MNRPSHSMRLLWLLGLVLLVGSTAGAIFALHPPGDKNGKAPADAPTESDKALTCYGQVDVEGGVTPLYALQPGRVTKVLVKENQKIEHPDKQPLLQLDDTLAKQRLEEAKADLRAAEDQLTLAQDLPEQLKLRIDQQQLAIDAAQQDVASANAAIERLEKLVKISQKSESDLEIARAQLRKLKAAERAEQKKLAELKLTKPALQIRRAEQDVAAKKARVDQAEYAVKECVLWAPEPGIILQVNVTPGTVLGPQPVQPAIVFCPDKPAIVRAEVEQEFANRVALGQAVIVQEENSTKQTWRGKLTRIADWYAPRRSSQSEALRLTSDVHMLECVVALEKNEPRLRVGQRVRVEIGK